MEFKERKKSDLAAELAAIQDEIKKLSKEHDKVAYSCEEIRTKVDKTRKAKQALSEYREDWKEQLDQAKE